MAKTKSKPAKKEAEVIELNLSELIMPATLLISTLILSTSLLIGMLTISAKIDNLNPDSGNNEDGDTATLGEDDEQEDTDTGTGQGDLATSIDDDPYVGDKDSAKVAIVEFSDYSCGYCARHHSDTYPSLIENYVDSGKAVYSFRDFAIFTPESAAAAQCLFNAQGWDAYSEYRTKLFDSDDKSVDTLVSLAEEVGANGDDIRSCIESDDAQNEVTADGDAARALGIGGTPGFIIGKLNSDGSVTDATLVSGAQEIEYFESVIDSYL